MQRAPRPPLRHRLRPGQWLVVDALAAAGFGVVAWGFLGAHIDAWPLAAIGTAAACGAVLSARRWPVAAAAVALAVFWLSPLAAQFGWIAAAPLAYALYRVAERHAVRVAAVALIAALTGPLATALPAFAQSGGILPFGMLLVVAWTIGVAVRQHHRYTDELVRHHVGRAEAELERAQRRVADERIRIARELHDVVAHSMSVITVQAGYGRLVLDRQPDKAAQALTAIEATGRESLIELRRVLDVLRDAEPAQIEPTPSLADLPRLAQQTAAAGVRVDLRIEGDPRDLAAGLELSAFRIVQEALTNVVKHAGTDCARVVVTYRPDAVTLDVIDDGRGGPVDPDGHGLTGMRERVAVYGGTLRAAPRPDRGFHVAACLPASPGWSAA